MFCISSKSQIITNFYNKENKIQRTSICPHEYNFFKRMKIKVWLGRIDWLYSLAGGPLWIFLFWMMILKRMLSIIVIVMSSKWLQNKIKFYQHAIGWQGGSAKYKPTHVNHPCNVWVRESLDNYVWLCWSTIFLCREYSHRYGRTHAGEIVVKELSKNFPKLPIKGLTPFAQAMPEQYKNENAVIAYRNYYMGEKRHIANWKNREVPEWFE